MRRLLLGATALALVIGGVAPDAPAQETPPVAVEGGIRFAFHAPGAGTVHLAGEFNGWDPGALPMSDEDGDGVWEIVTELQVERTYQYKFVVDGGASWRQDPSNPHTIDDGHGGLNSVVSVTDDGDVVLGPLYAAAEVMHVPVVDDLPALGEPLCVAVLWHQHQPKYLKDLQTGEYMEPWVRMHAIKDYYDMVAILEHYPGIRFTVNLTPVLLTQLAEVIDGYESGKGSDEYLRMTLKDAADLNEDDQLFLITHFFNAHWDNMIHIWPRYSELKGKKGGDSRAELLESAATFSEQDWRDLQAWFNLAWFDPDFQEGNVTLPDGSTVTVKHLIDKGSGYTEEEKREIISYQIDIMRNVVAVHEEMQERGQIEVITTPFYHPILPLVLDTDLAKRAMPGTALPERRFARPEDARRHVEMAADYYETLLGRRPTGMWPGEGAVAQEIVGIVADAGFKWMATDDQILQRSLGGGPLTMRQRYQMYWVEEGEKRVGMIFRDHRLSDDIGFNFGRMDGVEAANTMMRALHGIHRQLAGDDRSYVVPIILDGENAWEWFKHDGKEFFHSWYDQMGRAEWLRTVTVSDYLEEHPPTETITDLWPGSWTSHNYAIWIGEREENTAWDYLAIVREDFERLADRGDLSESVIARAYDEMLAAEGSDWFWWYGSDQNSPNDGAFDEIFRGTLSNVYAIMGEEPPVFLSESILTAPPRVVTGDAEGTMARADDGTSPGLLAGPAEVDGGHLFSFEGASAGTVHLAGDFNDWSVDGTPMKDDDGDGVWTVTLELPPGRYEYKFVVDGGAEWVEDRGTRTSVPDPYGGTNSVIVVK